MDVPIGVRSAHVKRPKTLVCFICGREYGTRSLEIHIKTCQKKWEIEQNKLPKRQRKPCPTAPPNFHNMIRVAQGLKPIDEDGNEIEMDSFAGGDNMAISGNGTYDAIQHYNEAAYQNWDHNVLEPCPHCGRTFRPEALKRHLNSCTADRPLKRRIERTVNEDGKIVAQYADADQPKVAHLGAAARQAAADK